MAFLAAAHPVAFVPIRVISRGRSSHIHPVADSLRWWRWWRGQCGRPLSSPVSCQKTLQVINEPSSRTMNLLQ
jgi:hypothetical protein